MRIVHFFILISATIHGGYIPRGPGKKGIRKAESPCFCDSDAECTCMSDINTVFPKTKNVSKIVRQCINNRVPLLRPLNIKTGLL